MLVKLLREIDARASEITSSHADWPCRRGCDTCCRRLAELPRLTRAEWDWLDQGLACLPRDLQVRIGDRIRALKPAGEPHAVCPFLDLEAGSCLVYDYRPAACRTYGFYIERDRGLYCGQIEERVDSGEFAGVVWGNVAGVEARLKGLGERIGLIEWFNDSPEWPLRLLPTRPSTSADPCGAR